MHLDGLRVCIGVNACCTMSVIFPSVGRAKIVQFKWKLILENLHLGLHPIC